MSEPTINEEVETPTPEPEPVKEISKAEKAELELSDKLGVLKERGNLHFKKKSYKDAIKQFSEGINLFEATGKPMGNEDLKTKVV